jgi:Rieske 2Fe-2S family protein
MTTTPTAPAQAPAALPREAYVSPDIYARELERIFYSTWQYVDHISEFSQTGSFKRYTVGAADVLVVRDGDGRLNAMHNVCRHRGAQLVADDAGLCKRAVVCSYHGWTYGHDGSLRGAPKMGPGFDKSAFGLKPADVEVWNGMVFVHVGNGNPPPVRESLAKVAWPFTDLERARVAQTNVHELDVNWKVAWENGLECYHCAINHPELVRVFDQDGDAGGADGGADYVFFDAPLVGSAITITVSGQLANSVLFAHDVPLEQARGFLQWHTSTFEMIAQPDCIVLQTFTPLAPDRTRLTHTFLVPADAVECRDYDPKTLFELHSITRRQDNELCQKVQRGVRNLAYAPGPFNEIYEVENLRFLSTYNRLMDGQD